MTITQINRTVKALIETKALLNKEMAYKQEFQKKDMISSYNDHIAKLEKMLSDSWAEKTA